MVSRLNVCPLALFSPKYPAAAFKTNAKKHIVEIQKDRDL
jgi:hypothetical protein